MVCRRRCVAKKWQIGDQAVAVAGFCTVGIMLFECSAYGEDPSFAREEECILSDMLSLSSCEGG